MINKIGRATVVAALALTAAWGCKEDDIDVSDKYDRPVNAAAPIIKGQGTATAIAERWLSGTKWERGDDGLLRTVYTSRDSATADDALKMADATFGIDTHATDEESEATVSTTPWDTVEGQKIMSLTLKSGTLRIASAATPYAGRARLRLMDREGVVRDGGGDEVGAEWALADGTDTEVDLSGVTIKPILTDDGHWHIDVAVGLTGADDGAPLMVCGTLEGLKVSDAYGYFGNHLMLSDNTTVRVVAFDRNDFPEGVEFKGAEADVSLSSTVGAPLRWEMGDLTFTDKAGKSTSLGYTPGTVDFGQQSFADYWETGTLRPQTRTFHIDESNSNIYAAINAHPVKYEYTQSLVANPDGASLTETNFVGRESGFSSEVRTTIPMWVRIKRLTYDDGVDMDFRDIFDDDNVDYVDSIRIRITTDNGLPLKAYAQGYFTANKEAVGKLFDDRTVICQTAQMGADDKVTAPTHTEATCTLTHEDVRRYYDMGVDRLAFECVVTTEDTGDRFVKIFADYAVKWKVTMDITSSAKE